MNKMNDKISVGDGGYMLGGSTSPIIDVIDHSADFLDSPFRDDKILMCDGITGTMFEANKKACEEFSEKLNNALKEARNILAAEGFISGNFLIKRINSALEIAYENTNSCQNTGYMMIDEFKWFEFDDLKELEKPTEPVYDISWIRKRMKHCTNPMERKQLEKQLNAAFKAKKKGKKK